MEPRLGLSALTHLVPWLVWLWAGVVLAYGLWRAFARPDPDPIRASGPIRRSRSRVS